MVGRVMRAWAEGKGGRLAIEVLLVGQPRFVLAFHIVPLDVIAGEPTGVTATLVRTWRATEPRQEKNNQKASVLYFHKVLIPSTQKWIKPACL